jgi:hypothetical protein
MPSTKFRPFERQKSSHADLAIAQRRCDLLRKFRLNLYHRPINEHRLRASPFNPFGVERNYIPEYASVTATAWLRCGQLLIQLSDNKVAQVPELDNPRGLESAQEPVAWATARAPSGHSQPFGSVSKPLMRTLGDPGHAPLTNNLADCPGKNWLDG